MIGRKNYGPVTLSVQASEYHYCEPRVTGLPVDGYSRFEVALIEERTKRFLQPEDIGFTGASIYWEGDTVGAYVPVRIVKALKSHLDFMSNNPYWGDISE
jgi:hypothetical protein